MKHFYAILTLMGIALWTPAQTFLQSNATVSTCSGNYYDSGGPGGNYGNNQFSDFTVCSASGTCLQVNFTSFNLEDGFDFLDVYLGSSSFGPLFGSYTGNVSPGTLTLPSNCATFQFWSDFTVTRPGWAATISCVPCPAATTADCDSAMQVCSATSSFPIFANGFGIYNEIPPSGSYGNPDINPASFNSGCLLDDELNSTWIIFRIQTGGQLEFHFGNGAYPQTGFYDWAMYELTNATCADIPANNLAPVRCNWNCSTTGGTGIADGGSMPFSASPCNYEPPLNVVANQIFVICFSNWSNSNGTVGFEFETQPGNALVDCSPLLAADDVHLSGQALEGFHQLEWVVLSPDAVEEFWIETEAGAGWERVGTEAATAGRMAYAWARPMPAGGAATYRIGRLDADGAVRYSNVVEIASPIVARIHLSPNPVTERLGVVVGVDRPVELEVYDLGGRKVGGVSGLPEGGMFKTSLDVSGLPAGMYIAKAGGKSAVFVKN